MIKNRTQFDKRGVSPVVAVILMVAVTVVLSAAIGSFVFSMGSDTVGDDSNQAEVGVQTSLSDGMVTATIVTGSADKVTLLVNGVEQDNITSPEPGDSLSAPVADGDAITIIRSSNGKQSVVTSTKISGTSLTTETLVDFEGGTKTILLSEWSDWKLDNDDLTAQSTVVLSGEYSGEFHADGAGSRAYTVRSQQGEIRAASVTFQVDSALESGEHMGINFQNASNADRVSVLAVGMTASETLGIHQGTGVSLTIGTTYRAEFSHINYERDTFDVTVYRVSDGTVIYENSSVGFNGPADGIGRFGVGIDEDSGDNDIVYVDDITVSK